VEQRIGPIIPPAHTAGTDPAYFPGLTPPGPAEAEGTASEQAAGHPPEDAVSEDAAPEEAAGAEEEPGAEEESEAGVDGPVFEVSDRRGSITAGHTGIVFRLDGETAEFRWDEIGAVEVDTPRFGRRFTVTVYTTTRRWYEADVEVPTRSLLKKWAAELDAVLDACFEDSEP
jgi:hypothetical protein